MLYEKRILDLVRPKDRDFLRSYLQFWQLGWVHYSRQQISSEVKAEKLKLLEKAMRRGYAIKNTELSKIQKYFVEENISQSLLLDLLPAWRYLAQNKEVYNEMQISEILGYASSPVARLIMTLNDQDPATYLPMQSMFISVLWIMVLEKSLNTGGKIKMPLRQKMSKIRGGIKNASVLLQIVSSGRLKFKTCVLYNTLKIYMIHKHTKLMILDDIKIILYSTIQFLWVKRRTTQIKKGI